MGKKRNIRSGVGDVVRAPGALDQQIERHNVAEARAKPRGVLKKTKQEGGFVSDTLSAKILKEASKQLACDGESDDEDAPKKTILPFAQQVVSTSIRTRRNTSSSDEDEDDQEDDEDELPKTLASEDLPDFLHGEDADRSMRDFASIVLDRANVKRVEFVREFENGGKPDPRAGLSTNVFQMYQEIGGYMSHYRSGKIPKAFKSIPALKNWEQILEITCPEKYTSAAMLHATRLFSATASPQVCERFYRYYLLPRVLDDILEYRKLNVHLFTALKKAVYKPTAFVKGILVPMCESDDVSMNAAHVMRAVVTATSLPVFHAATAMIKLARLPISSPVSHILSGFVSKRYTLPSMALQSLVDYFCSYEEEEPLPVSLHSIIQPFVQSYKLELTTEQIDSLIKLLSAKGNKNIKFDTLKQLQEVLDNAPEQMEM